MRNGQNDHETGSFSIKLTKYVKKTSGEIFCTFAGVASLTLDSELCNFITLRERMKTTPNFLQGSFPIKSLKLYHKNRISFLASSPV